jgi:hypothetical protein
MAAVLYGRAPRVRDRPAGPAAERAWPDALFGGFGARAERISVSASVSVSGGEQGAVLSHISASQATRGSSTVIRRRIPACRASAPWSLIVSSGLTREVSSAMCSLG